MMPEKIAILVSDLHLSHNPPIARCGESDWYEAMARPLRELRDLAGDLPVLHGGDLFDKWKSPPKLINFAMRELPISFWSVMGQHDMPYHNWEERKSSAFWTLVESDRLGLLDGMEKDGGIGWLSTKLAYTGFQWGEELLPLPKNERTELDGVKVAVAHKYCWYRDSKEESVAVEENHVGLHLKSLFGYDVVLFGDNHKGFLYEQTDVSVFNAGTFMRRRSDEVDCRPMVGILHEDGSVKIHHLDTSKDVLDADGTVERAEKMLSICIDSFVEELREMQDFGFCFERAIECVLEKNGTDRSVRRVVLESMEVK